MLQTTRCVYERVSRRHNEQLTDVYRFVWFFRSSGSSPSFGRPIICDLSARFLAKERFRNTFSNNSGQSAGAQLGLSRTKRNIWKHSDGERERERCKRVLRVKQAQMCCSARVRAKETKGREFDHVCSTIVPALRGLVLTICQFLFCFVFCSLSPSPIQDTWFVRHVYGFLGQGSTRGPFRSGVITLSPHADSRYTTALLNPIGPNDRFVSARRVCGSFGAPRTVLDARNLSLMLESPGFEL